MRFLKIPTQIGQELCHRGNFQSHENQASKPGDGSRVFTVGFTHCLGSGQRDLCSLPQHADTPGGSEWPWEGRSHHW